MSARKNPLKLNKLQLRTLALAHVLAGDENSATKNPETGEVTISQIPHAHGDHVHVGAFVVSGRDASGLSNPAVWTALGRKGLTRMDEMGRVVLTTSGLDYDTGFADQFMKPSDH